MLAPCYQWKREGWAGENITTARQKFKFQKCCLPFFVN